MRCNIPYKSIIRQKLFGLKYTYYDKGKVLQDLKQMQTLQS